MHDNHFSAAAQAEKLWRTTHRLVIAGHAAFATGSACALTHSTITAPNATPAFYWATIGCFLLYAALRGQQEKFEILADRYRLQGEFEWHIQPETNGPAFTG